MHRAGDLDNAVFVHGGNKAMYPIGFDHHELQEEGEDGWAHELIAKDGLLEQKLVRIEYEYILETYTGGDGGEGTLKLESIYKEGRTTSRDITTTTLISLTAHQTFGGGSNTTALA